MCQINHCDLSKSHNDVYVCAMLSFTPTIASVVMWKHHPKGPKDAAVVDLKENTLHAVSVP